MRNRQRTVAFRAAGISFVLGTAVCLAAENPFIYGIHDTDPQPTEFLNHVKAQVSGSWVTATVAVGHNPTDTGGVNFSWYAGQGHTVVCRINNGYCGSGGTIPLPADYADFAQRCANFVQNSPGCTIWVIGNETNLASEWPPSGSHLPYVSPQSYADCFRACYNAIKAVRPTHKVVSQGLAPWGGPYGSGSACGYTHDAMPLNWVQYLNQMLTAIHASGGIDGIGLHVPSRGYTYADIHSESKINAGGQDLYWSFYCYKDWVDLGIPPALYDRPMYITECNGNYYWKGGFPEDPSKHYEAGWVQEVLREINAYNQNAVNVGKPVFRCVNFYRWCAGCDGWNIDGADNPYKNQILSDLDAALALRYTWPVTAFNTDPPTGVNLAPSSTVVQTDSSLGTQTGAMAIDGIVSGPSKWVSNGDPPPHWIALDLGATQTVNGFVIRLPGLAGEPAYLNAAAFDFQISGSLSGPWTTEISIDNSVQASVVSRSYTTPKALRYVRLNITDPGVDNYARIPEFEVCGTPAPPTITLQPLPQTVPAGGTATFTAGASGSGTLTYRWQKNGADVTNGGHYAGATAATLTVSSVDTTDVARYRCAVTNGGGTTLTQEVWLRMQATGGAEFIVESRSGGKNYVNYSEYSQSGTFSNSTAKSAATGTTAGIGSRWGSTDRDASGIKRAAYSFTPAATGLYEVFSTWPASTNGGTGVEHVVTHAAGSASALLDQNETSNPLGANNWNSLGQYSLNAGTAYTVTQTNENYPEAGYVLRADAVKWQFISAPPPPPSAAFVADKTAGTPPLTVQFTDQSTGTIMTWLWDFGDGDQSTAANPAHTYEAPGTYSVTLTITGPTGSDTETKTNYITAAMAPNVPLIHNGSFSEGTNHWTKWTQRDTVGNFTTAAVSGQLVCSGSNYNGGMYQQFSTGGSGRPVVISGYWKSNPTIAGSQWAEIIVINSARLPADGVDETPESKPDDVLVFKNDTWTTPAGWDGSMNATAPVTNVGEFIAAADKATILIKSGNNGAGLTGLVADNLDVRIRPTSTDFDFDGDVDLTDFNYFRMCFNGPNRPPAITGCDPPDLDGDNDVDLADFSLFRNCFNGPNRPPACR